MAVGVPGAGMTHLTHPSLCGEEARSAMRPWPWLLWWRPESVRVEALGLQEPGQGTGLVAVAPSLCQHQEII